MWPQRPGHGLVQGWIDQALELASSDGAPRAKALLADSFWNRTTGREGAQEASALADGLGDPVLRSYAFAARSWIAFHDGEYAEAVDWSRRNLELVKELNDPDLVADVYEGAIPAYCGVGAFDEARRLAALHGDVVAPLTPHHRLHGVSVRLEVEELCGGWEPILGMSDRTAAAVEENLSTPCIRNARSLLVTALAAAQTGNGERAEALERRALDVALQGYDFVLGAPRARLALARGDVEGALRLVPVAEEFRVGFALSSVTARLDALAAAGEGDALEREAPRYLQPATYPEPFALRALGIVREDEELLARADEAFRAFGLESQATETERLLRLRQAAAA
jgi:hypothetical protein